MLFKNEKKYIPWASLDAKIASNWCKNTGDSQISLKIAKALARRSTLSKMWGLLNLEDDMPEPLEVEAEDAEAAAEAKPSKESTSEAAGLTPSGLFWAADAASSASAAWWGQPKADTAGDSSMTGGLESPGGARPIRAAASWAAKDPGAGRSTGLDSLEPPKLTSNLKRLKINKLQLIF